MRSFIPFCLFLWAGFIFFHEIPAWAVLQSSGSAEDISTEKRSSSELVPAYDKGPAASVFPALSSSSFPASGGSGDPYAFGYKKTAAAAVPKPDFISSIIQGPSAVRGRAAGEHASSAVKTPGSATKISYTLDELEAGKK